MTKTPCPHCYTAINETDTTCYSCGEAVEQVPMKSKEPTTQVRALGAEFDKHGYFGPQAAHGCCECDDTNQEPDRDQESAWVKVIWLIVGSIIGALITAFAKGEL